MDLILHCGESKTGSSSIQSYLLEHSPDLLARGIAYHAPDKRGHFDFVYLVGRTTRIPQDQHRARLEASRACIAELRSLALRHKVPYVLLSAESFFPLTPQEMDAIIGMLNMEFAAVHCLIYTRDPVNGFLSHVQQRLKGSTHVYQPALQTRSAARLIQWRDYVGRERFTLGLFDQVLAQGLDVVEDFLLKIKKITGADLPYAPAPRINDSLSAEQMLLLREFRRDFFSHLEDVFHPQSESLLRFFQEIRAHKALPLTRAQLKERYKRMIHANNREYRQDIEEAFGVDLGGVFWAPETETDARRIRNSAEVGLEDLLQDWNRGSYETLRLCIPRYNPALRTALDQRLAAAPLARDSARFFAALARYLAREGCRTASDQALHAAMDIACRQAAGGKSDAGLLHDLGRLFSARNILENAQKAFSLALETAPENRDYKLSLLGCLKALTGR